MRMVRTKERQALGFCEIIMTNPKFFRRGAPQKFALEP